jgi:hypothetical protein
VHYSTHYHCAILRQIIFERKIFRRIYGPKHENGEWKSSTNRELEEIGKGEITVKWIKGQVKMTTSPGENGRGQDAQKDLHSRTGGDKTQGKTQERMERGSRKRISSAKIEKMERIGGG